MVVEDGLEEAKISLEEEAMEMHEQVLGGGGGARRPRSVTMTTKMHEQHITSLKRVLDLLDCANIEYKTRDK